MSDFSTIPTFDGARLSDVLPLICADCHVVYAVPLSDKGCLRFRTFGEQRKAVIDNRAVLFLLREMTDLQPPEGEWMISLLPWYSIIEVIAMLDEAKNKSFDMFGDKPELPVAIDHFQDVINLPGDVVGCTEVTSLITFSVISGERLLTPLIDILRRHEAYSMLRFLLSHSDEEISVEQISYKYGLSAPYFRLLCRRHLQTTAKKKMMDWRAASAVLKLIESDQTMLDIALDCGYNSASHFTSHIRKTFGITPSEIRCLEKKLYANEA
ncbi:Transcriptional regulator invF [Serratia quinivorans]|uniref:helix-turn-helix domain-containing protein n=1 Tax=Serratia quinivorans TaxID=137545 RepID=UPI002178E183|nr:helix-turn-helix domain-containing protein [Serratia quinivorans]CAI1904792.1 Transcriptional regulator invF [Serratia quinivorans]